MNIYKELRAEGLIAKRYEERGYTVSVGPSVAEIPFSLGNFRPDILASRGDEHLIIEVKSSAERVDPAVYFEVDELVQQHPG
jgi:Holliday junction resolvase